MGIGVNLTGIPNALSPSPQPLSHPRARGGRARLHPLPNPSPIRDSVGKVRAGPRAKAQRRKGSDRASRKGAKTQRFGQGLAQRRKDAKVPHLSAPLRLCASAFECPASLQRSNVPTLQRSTVLPFYRSCTSLPSKPSNMSYGDVFSVWCSRRRRSKYCTGPVQSPIVSCIGSVSG